MVITSWLKLIMLFSFTVILLGALVAIILLLAHRKTRIATLAVLGAFAMVVVLLVVSITVPRFTAQERHARNAHAITVAEVDPSLQEFQTVFSKQLGAPSPEAAKEHMAAAFEQVRAAALDKTVQETKSRMASDNAVQGEDELSDVVATKTVGFLKAMMRALGRALAEEEKLLAVKKEVAKAVEPKPLSSPAGIGTGGESNSAVESPALTLTLSQRERGPSSEPVKAESRPDWVGTSPRSVGDAYQMSIAVGPYTTRAECDARLPEALREALAQYVEMCLAGQVPHGIRLPDDFLRQQVVRALWEETRQHSVGPMTWLHVLLKFDRKVKSRVLEEHRQAIVFENLQAVGIFAAVGLGLMATAFGYLKFDLATGGVYRSRLRIIAGAVILVGLLIAIVVAMA